MLQLAQLTDLIKAYDMIVTAKSSGLDFWEGLMLALFILKDIAIVGGILGTFIWYVKGKKQMSAVNEYSHDNVIDKITKLLERVNTSDFHENYEDDKDLIWCKRLLDDVKNSGLVPSKEEFRMANLMWKKYDFKPTSLQILNLD